VHWIALFINPEVSRVQSLAIDKIFQMNSVSTQNNVYALGIRVKKNLRISVGHLGKVSFPEGFYLYVGSAKKNLQARIKRHMKKKKSKFWHIDYLLSQPTADVVDVWTGTKIGECELAKKVSNSLSSKPVIGFGCSDCRCSSHLFHIMSSQTVLQSKLAEWLHKVETS